MKTLSFPPDFFEKPGNDVREADKLDVVSDSELHLDSSARGRAPGLAVSV